MASLKAVNGVTVEGVVTVTEGGGGGDLCGAFDLDLLGTRPPKPSKPLPKYSVGMNDVCGASCSLQLKISCSCDNFSHIQCTVQPGYKVRGFVQRKLTK